MLDACHTQAAKADDARAEKGSDLLVLQTIRQRKGEVRTHKGILGVSSINRVPRKSGLITQIFHSVIAIPTIAVNAAHPGNTDAHSERQLLSLAFDDLTDDLMARY